MFSRIEHNSWVASYRKLPLQCLYLTLVFAAMVITGVRISKIQGQATRSDTLAIVMGVKSVVLLSYQLLTTYANSLQRWRSLKAYMIIDYLEIVFWFVVVILGFMGVSRRCVGEVCALGIVVCLIAMLLMCLAAWLAVVATLDHRYFRTHGSARGTGYK